MLPEYLEIELGRLGRRIWGECNEGVRRLEMCKVMRMRYAMSRTWVSVRTLCEFGKFGNGLPEPS